MASPISPFDAGLGHEIIEASPDLMQSRCPVSDRVMQPYGIVHGGALAGIAETLASIGTFLGVGDAGNIALGQSNHTQFLRPIKEGTIHAVGRPRHRGRTSWIWDVEITDDDGALCALSRLTIAVRPARRD
ncbi:MAG: PaaI family thioesterase [Candidatus Dormibacteria bacterium]